MSFLSTADDAPTDDFACTASRDLSPTALFFAFSSARTEERSIGDNN